MNQWEELIVEEHPHPDDEAVVRTGLTAYNHLQTGIGDNYHRLAIFVRDENGKVAAGLIGGTYWGWLSVELLWVCDELRHRGYGSRLLRAAEGEAIRRHCRNVHLDTMSFQALPFYLKHGYTVWGELQDLPPGHTRHFLQKRLQPSC